jgi:hypothetical protein
VCISLIREAVNNLYLYVNNHHAPDEKANRLPHTTGNGTFAGLVKNSSPGMDRIIRWNYYTQHSAGVQLDQTNI